MASPFRIFRKHMKALLVVFGVMLIFAWVVGDAIMQYFGNSRRVSSDPSLDGGAIAVQWVGGTLTNDELRNLVVRRRILNAFIQNLEFAGRQAAYEAGIEPRPLRVEPMVGPDTPQQGVERSVVQSRLFSQAAREAGMHVSNDTIVRYLDEVGRGNVSRDDMRTMLNRLQSGNSRISIDYMIEALREEMLARNYIASHQFAFDTVTPQERWQDWLKVNDRIVVEAAAIPVERFVVDVAEPSEAELIAFFDEFKNRERQPDFIGQMEIPSPTPGFRIPRKIDVQYIEANYDQYVEKSEQEITDAEIEKFYEENKDPLFIKADTGLIDEPAESDDAADVEEAAADEPASDDAADAPSDSEAVEVEEETTDVSPPNEPVDTPAADNEAEPAAPKATEETTDSDAAAEEAAPEAGDQSSRDSRSTSPFRLANFLQDAEGQPSAEPADEAAEPDAEAAEPDAEAAESSEQQSDAAEPASDAADATASAAEEKPKEFQPLDEVRDVIRRQLAQQRAAEKLNELVNQLAGQLSGEFNQYFGQVLNAQAEERDPPPPPEKLADLTVLAKEHGLESGKTGPMSLLELRETQVGKSGSGETGVMLWRTLFGTRDLELYQPITTVDIDGNRYVAMKTSDTPARTPELADVKEEVIRAWKLQKASELALKYAEEQAKKAQEAGSTLADFFASDESVEVVRTDPFAQFTGGDVALVGGEFQQQPFRLSEPDGVVAPGPELLRSVFELKGNDVAAVLNHDHSNAYVVRVVEHMNSPQELRTAYLSEASTWPGLRLMISGHARVAAASLVNDIMTNAGLDWVRDPDQVAEQTEGEAG